MGPPYPTLRNRDLNLLDQSRLQWSLISASYQGLRRNVVRSRGGGQSPHARPSPGRPTRCGVNAVQLHLPDQSHLQWSLISVSYQRLRRNVVRSRGGGTSPHARSSPGRLTRCRVNGVRPPCGALHHLRSDWSLRANIELAPKTAIGSLPRRFPHKLPPQNMPFS